MSKRSIKSQTAIYQLEGLCVDSQLEAQFGELTLQANPAFTVQGSIEGAVIVSVPPEMSMESARELASEATKQLRKSVIVVTHNIQFLRAKKLSFEEAVKVQRRVRQSDEQEGNQDTSPSEADKSVGESSSSSESDGSRSGIRGNGTSDTGAASPESASSVGDGPHDNDEKGD